MRNIAMKRQNVFFVQDPCYIYLLTLCLKPGSSSDWPKFQVLQMCTLITFIYLCTYIILQYLIFISQNILTLVI